MLLNLLLLIGGELGLVYRLGCGGGWLNTGLLLEVCLLFLQLGKFGFLFLNLPELFSSFLCFVNRLWEKSGGFLVNWLRGGLLLEFGLLLL